MKSEQDIRKMIGIFEYRQNFFENLENREQNPDLPDEVEESACKVQALKWVLGEVEDLFCYPYTRKSLNLEFQCVKILDDIHKEMEAKDMEIIEKNYDRVKSYYDQWHLQPDEFGLKVVRDAVVELLNAIQEELDEQ